MLLCLLWCVCYHYMTVLCLKKHYWGFLRDTTEKCWPYHLKIAISSPDDVTATAWASPDDVTASCGQNCALMKTVSLLFVTALLANHGHLWACIWLGADVLFSEWVMPSVKMQQFGKMRSRASMEVCDSLRPLYLLAVMWHWWAVCWVETGEQLN